MGCTGSSAWSATGRCRGKTWAAMWNIILGKIHVGFKVSLVRETERMIQQKTQMYTFLFSGVFLNNKYTHT